MFNFGFGGRIKQRDKEVRPLLPAVLVFLAFMIVIGMSWRTAHDDIKSQQDSALTQNAAFIENTLRQRFNIYEDGLRASNGLYASSNDVNRDEWTTFAHTLELAERFPGILGLGYIKVISPSDISNMNEAAKADGIPEYSVHPVSDNEQLAPLYYMVPFNSPGYNDRNSPALGFDMYSDPLRKSAMIKAAETGQPTLSQVVNLVAVSGKVPSKGFLMFLPHYRKGVAVSTPAERLAALDGYFYSPFINSGVFTKLFASTPSYFAFGIYQNDITPHSLIFKNVYNLDDPTYNQIKTSLVTLYGQKWSLKYKIKEDIVPYSVRSRPTSVLIGGTIFSFSLALIIYLLIQRRTRELRYGEQLKLEEAKDELLSLASHQLRTPATAVKQYVSMVKDGFAGTMTNEQRRLLQMAYDSNERQLTIVDDLLYVARIDAGKAALRIEDVQIIDLVQSVINDQSSIIKNRKQIVILQKPKQAILMKADPQYLRMIFENLLSNASKYSHEDTKISIIIQKVSEQVVISFADKGVGIATKDYPNVFHKFSRIPNELTRQIAGSGIGLYLAKQLTLLHGGDITFESSLNKGSTFTVILPLPKKH